MTLVGLSVISNFKCKYHSVQIMCIIRNNGEDDGWWITVNYHSIWVSYMFVVIYVYILWLCSKLTNCFIWAKHAKHSMAAGDASQTTSVQITHVFIFSCCVVLHKSTYHTLENFHLQFFHCYKHLREKISRFSSTHENI